MEIDARELTKYACPFCGEPVTMIDNECPSCRKLLWQPGQNMMLLIRSKRIMVTAPATA